MVKDLYTYFNFIAGEKSESSTSKPFMGTNEGFVHFTLVYIMFTVSTNPQNTSFKYLGLYHAQVLTSGNIGYPHSSHTMMSLYSYCQKSKKTS